MVERVIQRRGERQRRQRIFVEGVENQREADADQNDANVLDGGIGEQPLHVHLHGSEHHAEQRGDQPQRQRQHAPPP